MKHVPQPITDTAEGLMPKTFEVGLAELRDQLAAAGAPEIVLDHVAPYSDQDVPYLYTGRGPHEAMNGSGGQASDGSESRLISDLMVGTDVPIGEIIATEYEDQTPHVKAQWRSRRYILKPGATDKVDREEVEQVGENTFVRRRYAGVSGLGKFDGELTSIVLLIPSEEFPLKSNYPGRFMYRHITFYRRGDGFVAEGFNVSGATLLNGIQELRNIDLAHIRTVRPVAKLALLNSDVADLSDRAAEQLVETPKQTLFATAERAVAEHPEIISNIGEAMDNLAPMALQSLAHPGSVSAAFEMFTYGVLKHPNIISILGRTLDGLDPTARFEIAQVLARGGQTEFAGWYEANFSNLDEGLRSDTFERIRTLNLAQFTEAWYRYTDGAFHEPDYYALSRDIALLRVGDPGGLEDYPLTRKIFEGLQAAAVAIFIEDYLVKQPAIARALHARK